MASGDSVDDVIRRIVELLDAARIPYMLTGSFASSLHGAPRATQDIDLVIALDSASLEALLKNFPDDQYYVSREAAFDAYRRRSLFNVIDFATGSKIDFIVKKSRDFSQLEFDRRAPAQVFGTTVFGASAEDVLLSKLEWARLAHSERQIDSLLIMPPDLTSSLKEAEQVEDDKGNNTTLATVDGWLAYKPEEIIDKVSPTPILFVQAEKDEIEADDTDKLYRKAKEPKKLFTLKDGVHFDVYGKRTDEAMKPVLEWFNQYHQ